MNMNIKIEKNIEMNINMRYMTIAEIEFYKELAKKYNTLSMICSSSNSGLEKPNILKSKRKDRKRVSKKGK